MKKLLILPAVILTMLLCFIPITASADEVNAYYGGTPTFPHYTLADCLANSPADTYVYAVWQYPESTSYDVWYLYSDETDITYTDENGILSIPRMSFNARYRRYSYLESADYWSTDSTSDRGQVSDISIDYINNTISGSLFSSFQGYDLICYSMCINGEEFNNASLNVEVDVSPELSGSFNRTSILPNGVSFTQDSFNFKVINNSRFGVQWAMAIVEEDAALPFNLLNYNERGVDTIDHTSDVKYVYISSELCYLQKGMSLWTTATINSPMHYTASNSNSGLNYIKWDMVNLEKNHNYDIVVYAVRNDADLTSYVESSLLYQGAYGDEVDLTNIQEVYRSTFSLVNPAVYNPYSSINGAVANDQNTDYDTLTNTMYSYTDVVDGVEQTIYGQYDYRSQILGQDKDLSYIDSYSGTGKFQKLMQNTSSVFSFYAGVLKFFPSDWLSMYQLGIFSLVVIAIIRRLT